MPYTPPTAAQRKAYTAAVAAHPPCVPQAPQHASGTPSNWRAVLLPVVQACAQLGPAPTTATQGPQHAAYQRHTLALGNALGAVTAGTCRTACAVVAQLLHHTTTAHQWHPPYTPARGYTTQPLATTAACTAPSSVQALHRLYTAAVVLCRQAACRRVPKWYGTVPKGTASHQRYAAGYTPTGWAPGLYQALSSLGNVLACVAGAVCRAQWARPLGYGRVRRRGSGYPYGPGSRPQGTTGVTSPRTTAQLAAYWAGTQPGTR
jgi:hypothetical protein